MELLRIPLLLLLRELSKCASARVNGTRDILAPIGSSVSLFCDPLLSAGRNSSAVWFLNGRPLGEVAGDRNLVLRHSRHASAEDRPNIGLLVISDLGRGDDGEYWCESADGEESQPIALRVAFLSEHFEVEPGWRLGRLGLPVSLHCRAPVGYPPPRIHWLKDGRRLAHSSGQLRLRSFAAGDEGRFTCVASNAAASRRVDGFLVPESLWGAPRPLGCTSLSMGLWFLAGLAVSATSVAVYAIGLLACCPDSRFKRRRWVIQGQYWDGAEQQPAFLPASHILQQMDT